MDRKNPQVAKLQENFMSGLVSSLSDAYASAGLLPGILIENSEKIGNNYFYNIFTLLLIKINLDESSDSEIETNRKSTKSKLFYCELTSNLKSNSEMWLEVLKQEELKNNKK